MCLLQADMKSILPLLVGLFYLNADLNAQTNDVVLDAQVAAAINTLKTNKVLPSYNENNGFGATSEDQYKQYLNSYNAQLKAMNILRAAKIQGTAPILLPYLNYCTSGFEGSLMHADFGALGQKTNVTLRIWPALAALVEIPGSGQVLASYALDKENPVKYRIEALAALKYVDMQKFRETADKMSNEFPKADFIGEYIQLIQSEDQRYMGTFMLDAHIK